jgi:hypothetical protein
MHQVGIDGGDADETRGERRLENQSGSMRRSGALALDDAGEGKGGVLAGVRAVIGRIFDARKVVWGLEPLAGEGLYAVPTGA